jgi:hypothetical protein
LEVFGSKAVVTQLEGPRLRVVSTFLVNKRDVTVPIQNPNIKTGIFIQASIKDLQKTIYTLTHCALVGMKLTKIVPPESNPCSQV